MKPAMTLAKNCAPVSGKDKLEKYSNFLEPQNEDEYSAIQLKLLQAGYKTKNAVRVYHFSQFALGIIMLLAGIAFAILKNSTGDPSTQNTMLMILGPGVVGYMFPKYLGYKTPTSASGRDRQWLSRLARSDAGFVLKLGNRWINPSFRVRQGNPCWFSCIGRRI